MTYVLSLGTNDEVANQRGIASGTSISRRRGNQFCAVARRPTCFVDGIPALPALPLSRAHVCRVARGTPVHRSAADQGGQPPGRRLLERRPRPGRSTTAAPTWASRCTRAPSSRGLVTCHWHHARFDLVTGGTLDPLADDARGFRGRADRRRGQRRSSSPAAATIAASTSSRRLDEGLEQGISLVIAKSVLGLLELGVTPEEIVRRGVAFGTRYREAGWGAGLTVLVAMANVLPALDPDDRALALVHGLAFVARDTRGRPAPLPRCAPLDRAAAEPTRLASWYRRFVETRSADAAERTLATAVASAGPDRGRRRDVRRGHRPRVPRRRPHPRLHDQGLRGARPAGRHDATEVLPTLVPQTAAATGRGGWRGGTRTTWPAVATAEDGLPDAVAGSRAAPSTTSRLARELLDDDPQRWSPRCSTRVHAGARPSSSDGRWPTPPRCASPASTCRTTSATGTTSTTPSPRPTRLHHGLVRAPSVALLRGLVPRRAARPPRPLPQRARRRACPTPRDRRPRRARRLLGDPGPRRPGRGVAAGHLRAGATRRGRRRPRPCAAARGRRVPLVPGVRGGRRRVPRSGPPGSEEGGWSSPASPASSPPTPRPAASSPGWSTSPPASAGARSSSKRSDGEVA